MYTTTEHPNADSARRGHCLSYCCCGDPLPPRRMSPVMHDLVEKNIHRKKCRLTSLYCQRMKNTIQLFPAQIANCQMKRNSQCVICIITCLICLLDGLDETLPWHGDYLMKALLDSLQISKANLSLSDLACSSLGRANKAKKSRSFGSCCSGSSSRTEKYKQTIKNEADRLVNMY